MKKWVWNNFSLRILLLISQSFLHVIRYEDILFSLAHTDVLRNKGSIIIFHKYTHTHIAHIGLEKRGFALCELKAVLLSLLQWLCGSAAATAITTNKGLPHCLQQHPLASAPSTLRAALVFNSTLIHCFALTHCSGHPLAYYSLCFLA